MTRTRERQRRLASVAVDCGVRRQRSHLRERYLSACWKYARQEIAIALHDGAHANNAYGDANSRMRRLATPKGHVVSTRGFQDVPRFKKDSSRDDQCAGASDPGPVASGPGDPHIRNKNGHTYTCDRKVLEPVTWFSDGGHVDVVV